MASLNINKMLSVINNENRFVICGLKYLQLWQFNQNDKETFTQADLLEQKDTNLNFVDMS
jgi:hypothetical protein